MNETKICLLGGDLRQTSLSRHLAAAGYETAVWGIPFHEYKEGAGISVVKCADPSGAVSGSNAVILPLPATKDGVRVFRTPSDEKHPELGADLRLTELMEMLRPGTLLLAGKPSEVLKAMARDSNVKLIDYYAREEIQIKNAIPTAEGAIALAMEGLPITLHEAETVVLGYGRIGQRLSSVLHALGARVTVVARSEKDRTWANITGCKTASLSDFLSHPCEPDVIFNTVPVPILTAAFLDKLPTNTLLIELASAPGCLEPKEEQACKQKILHAPSLPGRVAPTTAGKILFESIYHILTDEGVTPV